MHRLFGSLWVGVIGLSFGLSLGAAPRPAVPGGIEALERITKRFPTLDAFLADKAARKEYQAELVRFHGRSSFPCESFDEVISQIRRWIQVEPMVAQRLWSPRKNWRLDLPGKDSARFTHATQAFHDIWTDLSRAQCPTTRCGPVTLAAPGRWAAVLDGTAVFHGERGGRSVGDALVVTEVSRGEERARVVAGSLGSVPLKAWAKAVGGKTPIVEVDSRGELRTVLEGKTFGKATGFGFRDPLAEKLALFVPERCEKQKEGLKAAKVGGTNSVGKGKSGSASVVASNPGALGDLLIALQMPPLGSAASPPPKNLEAGLREKLTASPDAKQRAMAGMALNLLNQLTPKLPEEGRGLASVATPGFIESFSPPTRKALSRALKDPSPAVRAQAAFAISDSGGTRIVPAEPGKPVVLPPELREIQQPLQKALTEAFNAPAAATPAIPPTANLQPLLTPQGIQNRAFDQMITEGVPLKPSVKDELWKRAQNDPVPEAKVDAVSMIAKDYLFHTKQGSSAQALADLQDRLAANPELFHKVLAEIDRTLVDYCEECREKNIVR